MDNRTYISYLANIEALKTEREAMLLANEEKKDYCKETGLQLPYPPDCFFSLAQQFQKLSYT